VNVQVPESIGPGSSVPVTITVGGVTSQANVTLVVQSFGAGETFTVVEI
jgi:uncharacterized protein (TIGR03437 family)